MARSIRVVREEFALLRTPARGGAIWWPSEHQAAGVFHCAEVYRASGLCYACGIFPPTGTHLSNLESGLRGNGRTSLDLRILQMFK
ncbi:MAG TPA: hypothetical protein VMD99_09280 [Terriglobales bacterium]|nr:hypothetical protein [Terriglobales bacterium]